MAEVEQERAQLWAIYWGLRALRNPTPPLDQARRHLRQRLNPQPPPPPHPRGSARHQRQDSHLALVGDAK